MTPQAGQGGDPPDLGSVRHPGQQGQGLLWLAPPHEHLGQRHDRTRVVRHQVQGLAERRLVPLGHQAVGFAGGRRQPGHELRHRGLRQGADEAVDDLAVAHRIHGGDRLNLERRRYLRVLVDVDLDQLDGAVGRGHDAVAE